MKNAIFRKSGLLFVLGLCMQSLVFASDPIIVESVFTDQKIDSHERETASDFLIDEVNKRVNNPIKLASSLDFNEGQLLLITENFSDWPKGSNTTRKKFPLPETDEGFRIITLGNQIYIQGRGFRGLLFGIGHFLRKASYSDVISWKPLNVSTMPDKPIRGHQIGYRNTANSYDAWGVDQYEQYIRDMIVFGTNSIENIPDVDEQSPHFSLTNPEMNIELSRLSKKYQMDYWIWTPIEFDLNDQEKAEAYLDDQERLYKDLARLDAVFVPGGDPGSNPPELVLPMMEKMSEILKKYHPDAKMWLSLQGFDEQASQFVYDYLETQRPKWMGGLVAGPSSPRIDHSRAALSEDYKMRHYPDITHTVRSQYPNWWWDPVYNFTLGREPINPQPLRYQQVYLHTEQYNDGSVTYSDGIHDDLNKMVWSSLEWDKSADIYSVVEDYANYFFSTEEKAQLTDALFALEKNWDGAIKYNGSVPAALHLWEDADPNKIYNSDENWRWKMYLLRANYDSFVRDRFIYEERLELQANEILKQSDKLGSEAAIDSVKKVLARSDQHFENDPRRKQIFTLADELFELIGYQTSVPKYDAKNPERGAILDFVDRPLNNKWWLESELDRMQEWPEERKVSRLVQMGSWETLGEGSFYDDVGNIYKSPHVIKTHAPENDPFFQMSDNPGFDWWEEGYSKARLSWMSSSQWPVMEYSGLDPKAEYLIRMTGVGEFYTVADGQELEPISERKETGEVVEISVPRSLTKDGSLRLTWEKIDESHLNWRQHSRLNELWLIKK